MDDQVEGLVEKAWSKFQETPRSKRLMIAVSGIPGSGTPSTIRDFQGIHAYKQQAKRRSPPKSHRKSMSDTTNKTPV